MKNQKGISLISIIIAIVLLSSLSMVTIRTLNLSNEIINKAEEAVIKTAHGEINELLALNNQVYYIEKYTGEYDGNLIEYLKDKGFINENGVVNMPTLLGQKEAKIATGKGNNETDVYKVEANTEKDVKVIYYDKNGSAEQIGQLFSTT